MKHLTLIISILICSNLIGQNLETRLAEKIRVELFNRLDSLSIEHPTRVSCIDRSAQHQSTFLINNPTILGHRQYELMNGKQSIGDTIIKNPSTRVYVFCDTLLKFTAEIIYSSFYSDTTKLLNKLPSDVIKGFIGSKDHKEIMDSHHEFYGIGVRFKRSDEYPSLIDAVVTITYGGNFLIFNNTYPKHFTINTTSRIKFRQECEKNIVIRNN